MKKTTNHLQNLNTKEIKTMTTSKFINTAKKLVLLYHAKFFPLSVSHSYILHDSFDGPVGAHRPGDSHNALVKYEREEDYGVGLRCKIAE